MAGTSAPAPRWLRTADTVILFLEPVAASAGGFFPFESMVDPAAFRAHEFAPRPSLGFPCGIAESRKRVRNLFCGPLFGCFGTNHEQCQLVFGRLKARRSRTDAAGPKLSQLDRGRLLSIRSRGCARHARPNKLRWGRLARLLTRRRQIFAHPYASMAGFSLLTERCHNAGRLPGYRHGHRGATCLFALEKVGGGDRGWGCTS
jgi:hypothetical protein